MSTALLTLDPAQSPDRPDEEMLPEEPSDLEFEDMPMTDDAQWDVVVLEDGDCDPLPEPGDFWCEPDGPWGA